MIVTFRSHLSQRGEEGDGGVRGPARHEAQDGLHRRPQQPAVPSPVPQRPRARNRRLAGVRRHGAEYAHDGDVTEEDDEEGRWNGRFGSFFCESVFFIGFENKICCKKFCRTNSETNWSVFLKLHAFLSRRVKCCIVFL